MPAPTVEEPDRHLDLRGLKCPQPVLRARREVRRMTPGATLVLECTDLLAAIDIPHFARQDGLDLLRTERRGEVLMFWLRKLC